MSLMRAVVRTEVGPRLRLVPRPRPGPGDVLVRVRAVGLCRTDLQAADGAIPCPVGRVLGHEVAGFVEPGGDLVAVCPVFGCGACEVCGDGDEINCPARRMLGLDLDGAFADFVAVPRGHVYPLPAGADPLAAAYAEPLAAALGVLEAGLHPEHRVALLGDNRFAVLVERVLRAEGFRRVERPTGDAGGYDAVIETRSDDETLARMVRLARPRGLLVLKSRRPGLASFPLGPLLAKRLTVRAANYGPFRLAVSLIAEGRIEVGDLAGPCYPLGRFAEAFAAARADESLKVFLTADDDVRDHR